MPDPDDPVSHLLHTDSVKADSTKDETNVVTYSTSTSKDVRGSSSSSSGRSTIITGGSSSSSSSSSGSRIKVGTGRSVSAASSSGGGVGVFASEESKKAAKAGKEALEVCTGIRDKFPKMVPAELLPVWKEYDCDHKLSKSK